MQSFTLCRMSLSFKCIYVEKREDSWERVALRPEEILHGLQSSFVLVVINTSHRRGVTLAVLY